MPKAVQIKKGNVIKWRDVLWKVVDIQQTFTGKHGAYYQMKIQNVDDGHVEMERFSADQEIPRAFLENQRMEYLYPDVGSYVFMDPKTGDQIHVSEKLLEEVLPYLAYNAEVDVQLYEDRPIAVVLPASVVLEVTKTEPAVRGDTATAVTKPAELETGLVVKVPGHVKNGDKIQVDTRTGAFLGRA